MKKIETEKILCPTCSVLTNHDIVWKSGEKRIEDEEMGMWDSTKFFSLQCRGCETVTLKKEYMFSEDLDMRLINGEYKVFPEVTLWPKTGWRLLKLKNIRNAPPSVKRIYRETIEAYNSELPTLCSAGIRAIIEAVCKEEEIIKRDLKDKIDSLMEKGVVTQSLSEALHENRLLGNDALHESTLFGDTELKTAIELIETLIETVYETKKKTSLIKSMRESKKKSSG